MSEDETISPLPTKGVTFKDFNTHLPDIKEATLEGSQFEAPAYTGALAPPHPATPKQSVSPSERPPDAGGSNVQRPKTTMARRTASEKLLREEDLPNSSSIPRNPSQNSLRPGTVSPHKMSLDLSDVNGNTSERSLNSHQSSSRKTSHLESANLRSNSQISRKFTNGDSRSHSQISRKGTNGDLTSHSRKGEMSSRQPSVKHMSLDSGNVTPGSRDIVRRKGRVVENSW